MASRRSKKQPEAGSKAGLAYIVAAVAVLIAIAVKFAPPGLLNGVASSSSASGNARRAMTIEGSRIPAIEAFDASGGVVAVAKDDGPYDAALIIGYGVDNKFPSTPALESRTLLGAQLFCAKSAKNLILTGAPVDYSWENVSPAETMRHFAEKLIADGAELSFNSACNLACAAVIAGVGLAVDSAVSVVASMLISPMMGPIVGPLSASLIYSGRT